MTSLAETTRSLRARDRKALVAYFTAGYPDDASFDSLVRAAVDAGADIIEVGIPFSDPIADGPIIQKTSGEALARGMTLTRALETIARLSPQIEVPVVVMSYVNPILRFGVDAFAHAAAAWGIAPQDALITYLWAWIENQVMAAVKAVPLGQTDGQRMLLFLGKRIEETAGQASAINDDDFGNFAPGLAVLSSQHETQYSRLFRS